MINRMHKEYIFEEERPFASCHASTIVTLEDGDLLAAWFGGTKEGNLDVDIWLSRRSGGKWDKPIRVAGDPSIPYWNPVLHAYKDKVLLYFKVGHTIPEWYTLVMSSENGGRTWSEPRELVPGDIGGRGPVKNKLIVLGNGTWVAPASIEHDLWDAFVDLSSDCGMTWTRSGLVPLRRNANIHSPGDQTHSLLPQEAGFRGKGIIQPALWESTPGQVHMLLRSTDGWIYRSDSIDSGMTWSDASPTSLPNNNSGIDVVRMDNGILALVYNPVQGDWAARTPLVIRFSRDNGDSWSDEIVLEHEPGEYSYPAIIAEGSALYVTYTWKRERIAYWEILVNEGLKANEI
jgi:predicted neuraminidase